MDPSQQSFTGFIVLLRWCRSNVVCFAVALVLLWWRFGVSAMVVLLLVFWLCSGGVLVEF